MKHILHFFTLILCGYNWAQTTVNVYPDSLLTPIDQSLNFGTFYVPKTQEAQDDFLNNGHHMPVIRTHIIESAINNSSNLTESLTFLDNVSTTIQQLSQKCDQLLFIFEKMPAWLSSSSDGSPAISGWSVLNTKPPANYNDWNAMVAAVTDKIVNDMGVSNAAFEIWNEPDLGSWTGTEAEFFELFRETHQSIKSVDSNIPVGGVAVNAWQNQIFTQPAYGYVSYTSADTSLLGQMIDSTLSWGIQLDFLSWHHFNYDHQTHANALEYLQQKYQNLGQSMPDLIVSEWNSPSQTRDTPFHPAFMVKTQIKFAELGLHKHLIAAWQDFEENTSNEFHQDYGLLTYNAIYKPAYNAIRVAKMLKGTEIKVDANAPVDIKASRSNDTLFILVNNYSPPAYVEAMNHTLFVGHTTITDLDDGGYIDIQNGDLSPLISIYDGSTTISNSDAVSTAINASVPIYQHYDSLFYQDRHFNIQIPVINNLYEGFVYAVDSTHNNLQYNYDVLIGQGYSNSAAVTQMTSQSMGIYSQTAYISNGEMNLQLNHNGVYLFIFKIPELQNLTDFNSSSSWQITPNPVKDFFYIQTDSNQLGPIYIYNSQGQLVKECQAYNSIDLKNFEKGVYLVHIPSLNETKKLIKL